MAGMTFSQEGKLVNITGEGIIYIVSDFHGNLVDLEQILKNEPIEEGLKRKEAAFIITGDGIDRGEQSRGVMDRIQRLKNSYGDHLQYVIGNHDILDMEIYLGQVEDKMLKSDLYHKQNAFAYDSMNDSDLEFFEKSPLVVRLSNGVIVTHAGPSRIKDTRTVLESFEEPYQQVIAGKDLRKKMSNKHYNLMFQLIWGRHQSLANPLSPSVYTGEDTQKFLKMMRSKLLINGHTPIKEGLKLFDDNNIILCSSYGADDAWKTYLAFDLGDKVDGGYRFMKKAERFVNKRN